MLNERKTRNRKKRRETPSLELGPATMDELEDAVELDGVVTRREWEWEVAWI